MHREAGGHPCAQCKYAEASGGDRFSPEEALIMQDVNLFFRLLDWSAGDRATALDIMASLAA